MQLLERQCQLEVRQHFLEFFERHDYERDTNKVVSYIVSSLADVQSTYYGPGFYLIQTDYQSDDNTCLHMMDGLKTIYRGHCSTVKKRLVSHLLNEDYRANLPERGVRYDVCLNLDGESGINITKPPYKDYRWRVVIHKMRGSSKMIREQAELAFDMKFGRPLGSREAAASD